MGREDRRDGGKILSTQSHGIQVLISNVGKMERATEDGTTNPNQKVEGMNWSREGYRAWHQCREELLDHC